MTFNPDPQLIRIMFSSGRKRSKS